MATSQDFDNIDPEGASYLARQWRYLARAVKGLKPIFEGNSFITLTGTEDKTIANGLIGSWTKGTIYVSPESGTTDDFIGITPTVGLENGTYITIRLKNGAHAITLKHNSGSTAYKFQLLYGLDLELNSTTQVIMFMFKDNIWYEHSRSGYEDFHPVTFVNSWANSPGFATVYYKNSVGDVYINGAVTKTPNATNSTLFTLPVGYRPSALKAYPVYATLAAANRSQDIVSIDSSGVVLWQATDGNIVANPLTVYLDNVGPFRAEQ